MFLLMVWAKTSELKRKFNDKGKSQKECESAVSKSCGDEATGKYRRGEDEKRRVEASFLRAYPPDQLPACWRPGSPGTAISARRRVRANEEQGW